VPPLSLKTGAAARSDGHFRNATKNPGAGVKIGEFVPRVFEYLENLGKKFPVGNVETLLFFRHS
jgi:hypothetical protein